MSVWSAPITAGAGTRPTISATPTSTADVGVAAMEYSGLSGAAGTAVVDQSTQASGKTTAAAAVSTAPTGATTAPNELVMGFYADSGFGDSLMARMGYNERVNVSPDGDMELLAEDALSGATGSTPSTSVQSGSATVWLMATLVLKSAPAAQQMSMPASAPMDVLAFPDNGSATITWSAARNGGSQITLYRVTPYARGKRLPSTYTSTNSVQVPGLRNGVRYRFRVVAINVLGSGPRSRLSNAVVPERWLLTLQWCSPLLSPYV
ncbi:MAG TPA: fibronectin type III domain-containing protein [Solirubrobacteraceae bacterium]|nr:fibronectin type III domain-containing protein [Solirubrobacteraceae bacterium]